MTHSVKVTSVGNSTMAGYQTKATATEFFEYYIGNQMSDAAQFSAIAENDTTGLWAIHGTDIEAAWATTHTFTFDQSTQTLTYIVDWPSEDVYNHWQTIKAGLDYTDESFDDMDLTYQYITKTEEVV